MSQVPVVQSLLETDLYKFTMWQALLHSYPGIQAEYSFVCRTTPTFPLAELKEEVETELDRLCTLTFSLEELDYLRSLRFIKSDFVDFLSVFRFQRRFITVKAVGEKLEIVAKGPIVHVMSFEIFTLYIVNKLYFRRLGDEEATLAEARRRLKAKIALIAESDDLRGSTPFSGFTFSELGVRRRYSGAWHEEVLRALAENLPQHFTGTSDVYLAKKLGLTPIGTMAHEYLQAHQAVGVRLRDFQKAALEGWVQEYRGDLGIALTDVVGMDAFLRDFDLYFAKLFDGLRHDSGDPVVWGEKAIAHYQKLRIDPLTKQLIFSDGLDMPTALKLYRYFKGRIRTSYGIGTHLTNDTPKKALNIVMKLVACNGQTVAKLSDSSGKTLCDDETFLSYLRQVFQQPAMS
ncbi:nicotinate phosphoribosyltransferase [Betaproteobacteria bacterium]|nr:nicotinate phosphoribosyltransferase [Betaproteobacteria bacterium]